MELKENQIVMNKRGNYGVVAGFNGVACLVVYAAYTAQPSRFDEELRIKGKDDTCDYNIVKVWNGAKVENFKDVYKRSFDPEKLELEVVFNKEVKENA